MKKQTYENKNQLSISGCLVKDSFNTEKVARFRIAHNTSKGKPAVFIDCVMFPNENRGIPAELLKKGAKVVITGHLHVNERESSKEEGKTYQSLELVVDTIKENTPVEIDVEEGNATVTLSEDGDDLPEA